MRMEAVTIHDRLPFAHNSILAYDLADLLKLAGDNALTSIWSCEKVWCIGIGADELQLTAESGPINGVKLEELASGVSQTIEGVFEAILPGETQPWLILKAINGCYFVVITTCQILLAEVKKRFHDVRPSPEDSDWYE